MENRDSIKALWEAYAKAGGLIGKVGRAEGLASIKATREGIKAAGLHMVRTEWRGERYLQPVHPDAKTVAVLVRLAAAGVQAAPPEKWQQGAQIRNVGRWAKYARSCPWSHQYSDWAVVAWYQRSRRGAKWLERREWKTGLSGAASEVSHARAAGLLASVAVKVRAPYRLVDHYLAVPGHKRRLLQREISGRGVAYHGEPGMSVADLIRALEEKREKATKAKAERVAGGGLVTVSGLRREFGFCADGIRDAAAEAGLPLRPVTVRELVAKLRAHDWRGSEWRDDVAKVLAKYRHAAR